jgi:hypothetical protein
VKPSSPVTGMTKLMCAVARPAGILRCAFIEELAHDLAKLAVQILKPADKNAKPGARR